MCTAIFKEKSKAAAGAQTTFCHHGKTDSRDKIAFFIDTRSDEIAKTRLQKQDCKDKVFFTDTQSDEIVPCLVLNRF